MWNLHANGTSDITNYTLIGQTDHAEQDASKRDGTTLLYYFRVKQIRFP